jgi:hypothetical protein
MASRKDFECKDTGTPTKMPLRNPVSQPCSRMRCGPGEADNLRCTERVVCVLGPGRGSPVCEGKSPVRIIA